TVAASTGVLANDSDVENNTLSAATVSTVGHGTLSFGSNGAFVYTPAANFFGTDSFTYKANDGQASNNLSGLATVTLTVISVNDNPVANSDSYSVSEDNVLTVAASTGVLA